MSKEDAPSNASRGCRLSTRRFRWVQSVVSTSENSEPSHLHGQSLEKLPVRVFSWPVVHLVGRVLVPLGPVYYRRTRTDGRGLATAVPGGTACCARHVGTLIPVVAGYDQPHARVRAEELEHHPPERDVRTKGRRRPARWCVRRRRLPSRESI